jgi:capsid assembly protease
MTQFHLPHVAARVYGTPLLLAPSKVAAIIAAIGPRLTGDGGLPAPAAWHDDEGPETGAPGRPYGITPEGIGILPVVGSMVRRGAFLDAMSGLQSYAALVADVETALADPGVRGLLLELDTPGGEAGGAFDAFDTIRKAVNASGKPVWSIANEGALSAGYALAAVTDRIWVTRTGEVGSIGVVALHTDQSKADAKAGLTYTYIHAGEHKVDGNPHEPLSNPVRADLQRDVDALYEMFVEHVALHRGMSADDLRATEARVYRGADAVAAGLADGLGTMTEVVSAFARSLDRPSRLVNPTGGRAALSHPQEHVAMADTLKGGAQSYVALSKAEDEDEDAKKAKRAGTDEDEDAKKSKRAGDDEDDKATKSKAASEDDEDDKATKKSKRAYDEDDEKDAKASAIRIVEVAEMARKLGVTVDAAKAIRDGVDPAALQDQVMRTLANRASAQPTVSAHAAPPAPAASGGAWDAVFKSKRR